MVFCSNCGTKHEDGGERFCNECGQELCAVVPEVIGGSFISCPSCGGTNIGEHVYSENSKIGLGLIFLIVILASFALVGWIVIGIILAARKKQRMCRYNCRWCGNQWVVHL